jgi:hypothetical protein
LQGANAAAQIAAAGERDKRCVWSAQRVSKILEPQRGPRLASRG